MMEDWNRIKIPRVATPPISDEGTEVEDWRQAESGHRRRAPSNRGSSLPPAMALEDLTGPILDTILSKLDPRSAATFACVSSRCRDSAADDALWRNFCLREFDLEDPKDPDGNVCPSFKAAYQTWQGSFGMYPSALVRKTKKCWDNMKRWLAVNFPEAGNTLQRGASEAEIQEAEEKLGVKLPLPTKMIYRFCNGQNTMLTDFHHNSPLEVMGLIGGYLFYDHLVNVHFLPLSLVIEETKEYLSALANNGRQYICVAASSYAEKSFFLDCTSGELFVGTKNLVRDGEMLPCVPSELIVLGNSSTDDLQQDALLLWLEEHARRLQDGTIQMRTLKDRRYICLYPELPPSCSTAVTNSVQVRASAVFSPELSDPSGIGILIERFYFSYSVRMSLLPGGGLLDGMHFSSCQLITRHWIISAKDEVVTDVQGEAVIGKFPLLVAGEPEFVYESCTPLPSLPGSIEGSFAFVPGRIFSPEGRQFDVEVPHFDLDIPGYIF